MYKQKQTALASCFISGDPLTALLKRKFSFPTAIIVACIFITLNLPIIISTYLNDAWLLKNNHIGLFQNYSWWILQSTSVLATVYFFFWLPDGIRNVINGLEKNKVFGLPKSPDSLTMNDITKEFDKSYNHWIWAILSLGVILFFLIEFVIPEHRTFIYLWETSSPFTFWYTIFFWGFFFYIGLLGIMRIIVAIYWFNRLFKNFNIEVMVLHPDGAGGILPLGDFSVKIGYLIGIFGIANVSTILSQSYITTGYFTGPMMNASLVSLVIIYIVLTPIIFFVPIWSARSAMKTAKDDFILSVSEQFEIDKNKMKSNLKKSHKDLEENISKIEQLQKIYDIGVRFPVWPFNVSNLVRFFSSIVSPIILGRIVPPFIDFLIKNIIK